MSLHEHKQSASGERNIPQSRQLTQGRVLERNQGASRKYNKEIEEALSFSNENFEAFFLPDLEKNALTNLPASFSEDIYFRYQTCTRKTEAENFDTSSAA